MRKKIEALAQMYATALELYGVDITGKFETATQMSLALEKAYLKGRSDEANRKWIPVSK